MPSSPETPIYSASLPRLSDGAKIAKASGLSAFRLGKTMRVVYPKLLRLIFSRRRPEPIEVREVFEQLGATYIKLGQLIASTPSLFPKDYVEAFQGCLDQVAPIPFRKVKKVIEKDLGAPIGQLFSYIGPEPLASASIAQVHAATLLTGEDVVIKVQKPGVENILSTDMNFIFVFSRLFEILSPGLTKDSITDMVSELYQGMVDECDFVKEASNLEAFNCFLKDEGITDVIAPKPYHKVSGKKVLTMERFYGVALTDYGSLIKNNDDAAEILITGMNTWFASLMRCDFFHADLHGGNIMLLEDGRLGFIDFGLVGRIKPTVWKGLFSLMGGISNNNYGLVAQSMVDVGMTSESVDVNALAKDIEALLNKPLPSDLGANKKFDDEINNLLIELAELGKSYGIKFPRSFTLLLKQFLYFDRYIQMIIPDMDIFEDDRIKY